MYIAFLAVVVVCGNLFIFNKHRLQITSCIFNGNIILLVCGLQKVLGSCGPCGLVGYVANRLEVEASHTAKMICEDV